MRSSCSLQLPVPEHSLQDLLQLPLHLELDPVGRGGCLVLGHEGEVGLELSLDLVGVDPLLVPVEAASDPVDEHLHRREPVAELLGLADAGVQEIDAVVGLPHLLDGVVELVLVVAEVPVPEPEVSAVHLPDIFLQFLCDLVEGGLAVAVVLVEPLPPGLPGGDVLELGGVVPPPDQLPPPHLESLRAGFEVDASVHMNSHDMNHCDYPF